MEKDFVVASGATRIAVRLPKAQSAPPSAGVIWLAWVTAVTVVAPPSVASRLIPAPVEYQRRPSGPTVMSRNPPGITNDAVVAGGTVRVSLVIRPPAAS